MKRRSFLKYTGSACTSAFLGSNVSLAENNVSDTKDSSAYIDRDLL